MAASEKDREKIVHKAREIQDSAQRAAYLNEACGADPGLRAEVEALLEEPWRDLYENIQKRRDALEKWNKGHVKIYKYSGYILSIAIPLLAALVTYLSASTSSKIAPASIAGLCLTFLTVLNEVLKPSQRFLSAVQLSHDLEEFKTDVEIELRELSKGVPQDLGRIHTVLRTGNRQLSAMGEAMARGTLSPSVPETEEWD